MSFGHPVGCLPIMVSARGGGMSGCLLGTLWAVCQSWFQPEGRDVWVSFGYPVGCLPIMDSARGKGRLGVFWAPCGLFTNHGFSQRGRMSGCLWSTLWAVNNFNFVLAIQGITIRRHLETCLVKTMVHTCKMQYTIPLLMKMSALFTSEGQQAQDCQSSKTLESINLS